MSCTPLLFLPAPLQARPFSQSPVSPLSFTDLRVTPHYPAKPALDDVLRYVSLGSDSYVTEKYAAEIGALLAHWSSALRTQLPALTTFAALEMQASVLASATETSVRSGGAVEVVRRRFATGQVAGRERFLDQLSQYMAPFSRLDTAEFELVGIEESQALLKIKIRYDLVGVRKDKVREGRTGHWLTQWSRNDSNAWSMNRLEAEEETVTRARGPLFTDVTSHALGRTDSYREQLTHGVDYWRTVLDGDIGIDVYGNNGVCAGDFDNDGFDDIYVCQPAGLPNRLYRNRGDGTFDGSVL